MWTRFVDEVVIHGFLCVLIRV